MVRIESPCCNDGNGSRIFVSNRLTKAVKFNFDTVHHFKISIQQAASYPNLVYHFCGGTLIHQSHVLTAAHCVTTDSGSVISPSFFMLVGDELYLNYLSVTRQARTVSHVFVHPEYSVNGILNDAALLRTSSPFTVSSTFSPVNRIPFSPSPGTSCSVAGWGTIYYEGPLSPTLLRINATIIDRAVCNGAESYEGFVREGMFCAGNMAGGVDACCALQNLPGVYTDVAVYNNWIDEKIYWAGEHDDIVTPTTIVVETTSSTTTSFPNHSNVIAVSINLMMTAFALVLITMSW